MTAATRTSHSITLSQDTSLFTRIRIGVQALIVLKDDQANPFYARLLHLSFDREVYARLAARMREHDAYRAVFPDVAVLKLPALVLESVSVIVSVALSTSLTTMSVKSSAVSSVKVSAALKFVAVGPLDGRPVVCDDTCYFLPCDSAAEARALATRLNGPLARDFFSAFVFPDAKRPLTAEILGSLDLAALAAAGT